MERDEYIRVVKPGADSLSTYLSGFWNQRHLALTLSVRDIKAKFSQTLLGVGWVLIQPAIYVIIFSLFFGYALGWKSDNIPYPLYALSGLLVWNLFSFIVVNGSLGIQDSAMMIRHIAFPRILIPVSKILTGLVDFGIGLAFYIVLMLIYASFPGWKIIFLPFICLGVCLTALGFVFWISSFAFKYRDILHALPFFLFAGIWVTPVFITPDILPRSVSLIFYLNPVSGWIEVCRFCLFNTWHFDLLYLPSMLIALLFMFLGLIIFIRRESFFSDYV
ncbi:MAG: ABC transporter permease [Flavobacteriales bacterium]|nr:ABC transporter permease [Flavobacteriales bacterium]